MAGRKRAKRTRGWQEERRKPGTSRFCYDQWQTGTQRAAVRIDPRDYVGLRRIPLSPGSPHPSSADLRFPPLLPSPRAILRSRSSTIYSGLLLFPFFCIQRSTSFDSSRNSPCFIFISLFHTA